MRRLIAILTLLAVALPASATECGPATWTSDTSETLLVSVQLGEGYEQVEVSPGETIEYWAAEPAEMWAIWAGDVVLAQGKQCGEKFVPPANPDPVESPDEPTTTTTTTTVPVEKATPRSSPTPAGVFII